MPVRPEEPLLRRRRKWGGKYDVSELSPGGPTTLDESWWFPNLADLECRACGQTGRCTPGCPQEIPSEEWIMKKCKVEGCDNDAAAERGAYALLCLAHREEKARARGIVRVPDGELEEMIADVETEIEIVEQQLAEQNGHDETASLLVQLAIEVERKRAELDEAIAALVRQLEAVR